MKYRDTKRLGPSEAVPFIPGEGARDRHARRLREADQQIEVAVLELAKIGARLTVTNGGHHWLITQGSQRAEWWPSSAKLVFNKRWNRGIHAHDWSQVLAAVSRAWRR